MQYINSLNIKVAKLGVVKSYPSRFRQNFFKNRYLKKGEISLILIFRLMHVIWVSLFRAWKYDLVYTNKDILPNLNIFLAEKILWLFNKKLVFDIDDAIYLGPRGKKLDVIWKYYKYVIAGSPVHIEYINKRYPSLKCFYVPMGIDTKKYQPIKKRPYGKMRIGWSGSHHTNIYALPLLEPIMTELSLKIDFEFIIISNKDPEIRWKNIETRFIEWTPEMEVSGLQQIDIGLMPLNDNDFERGKCSLKALQYMAVGVPALVSPVGVNSIIVDHGYNGFHCVDNKSFVENIIKLVTNKKLRGEMGLNARDTILTKHSIDVLSDKYINIFNQIASE